MGNETDNIDEYKMTGKRSIRKTNAGNIHGYVGRRYYRYIGEAYSEQTDKFAAAWVNGDVDIDAGVWDQLFD